MITVSKRQMAELEPEVIKPFLKKMQNIVQESCKQSTKNMSSEQIYMQVQNEYLACKHFGIKTERGIIRFILLSFILQPKFYTFADFLPIFRQGNYHIDSDIDQLYIEIEKHLKA